MCFVNDNLDNELKHVEIYAILAEAEDDVRVGRIATMQDTFDDIRASLIERKDDD